MTAIAIVLTISMGMQLVAFACPSGSKLSRKAATSILLNISLLAWFFFWVRPLVSFHPFQYFVLSAVAYLALHSAWPVNNQWRLSQQFNLAISLPLGVGAISWLWLMWLLLGGRNASVPFSIVVCFVSLIASLLLMMVRHHMQGEAKPELTPKSERHPLIEFSAAAAGVCSLLRIPYELSHEPHGLWDAWMLWNTRAHFLFRTGADWVKQFSGHDVFFMLHPDYPLLLPASVSAIWQLKGQESITAPMVISGLFTIATVSMLMIGVALLRTRNQGYFAGLAIMGVPSLYLWGCSQEADVPLAAFMLGALICFSLHGVTKQRGLLYLSGTFAGMAAWTKNEGGLFALLFGLFTFLGLYLTSQTRHSRSKNWMFFTVGLLPWAILLILFKTLLAPPNDLFQQPLQQVLAKLFEFARYQKILSSFTHEFCDFGLPILCVYGLLFGLRFQRSSLISILLIAATTIAMFVGYFFIFVTSPLDLPEHLRMAENRLFLQLWPSLLLLFFSVVQTPEDLYRRFGVSES